MGSSESGHQIGHRNISQLDDVRAAFSRMFIPVVADEHPSFASPRSTSRSTIEEVRLPISDPISRIAWPSLLGEHRVPLFLGSPDSDELIFATGEQGNPSFNLFDANSGAVQSLQKPAADES